MQMHINDCSRTTAYMERINTCIDVSFTQRLSWKHIDTTSGLRRLIWKSTRVVGMIGIDDLQAFKVPAVQKRILPANGNVICLVIDLYDTWRTHRNPDRIIIIASDSIQVVLRDLHQIRFNIRCNWYNCDLFKRIGFSFKACLQPESWIAIQ